MASLTVTPEQKTLLEALAVDLDDALTEGVDDGSPPTFIGEMNGYTLLTDELKTKTKDFLNAGFAAAMAAEVFQTPYPTPIYMSESSYGANCGANFTDATDVATTSGSVLIVTGNALVLTGLAFWWSGVGSRVIRLSLWNGATDTRITYVDVPVSTAGLYTGTFAVSQTLTPYTEYRISKWDSTATYRWHAEDADISTQTGGAMGAANFHSVQAGRGWWRGAGCHSAAGGDNIPNTDDSTAIYLVDPVFQ